MAALFARLRNQDHHAGAVVITVLRQYRGDNLAGNTRRRHDAMSSLQRLNAVREGGRHVAWNSSNAVALPSRVVSFEATP